jgi:hypothetical protein
MVFRADDRFRGDPARPTVIEPAQQLADHHQVGAAQHLGLERPGRLQPGPCARRPQVGVRAHAAADRKQRRLGSLIGRQVIEIRMADGAEQYRVGALRRRQRLGRQGRLDARIAAPPIRACVNSKVCPKAVPTACSTRTAAVVTSGPMPSPGIATIRAFMFDLGASPPDPLLAHIARFVRR